MKVKDKRNNVMKVYAIFIPGTDRGITWCEASHTAIDGTVYYARRECLKPKDDVSIAASLLQAQKRAMELAGMRG